MVPALSVVASPATVKDLASHLPDTNAAGNSSGIDTTARRRPRRRPSSPSGADTQRDADVAGSFGTESYFPQESSRDEPRFEHWKGVSLEHTWAAPLIVVLAILGAYYISPGEQNPLHHAIYLSYPNPAVRERTRAGNAIQYGKGPKDLAFVAFYTIILTFTREFVMQHVISPFARHFSIKGKEARFKEQSYTAIYLTIFCPLGVYAMIQTPVRYFCIEGMYKDFPHRTHEAVFKAYYLLQAAYWTQQSAVLVLQLEKPRKDFKELILHHVVTVALIGLSYRFHFTYMGIAVFVTHDVSDFFLATSKVLHYIDSPMAAPCFIAFMCIWAYLRHYINLRIIYSLLPNGQFKSVGPYELDWSLEQYKCWISQAITFVLLGTLQVLNLLWFFLICRVVYRFLKTGEERDDRSDYEEEGEERHVALRPEDSSKPTAMY